eukprot:354526-Chlamydomonas_euryale.AAC.12
MSSISEPAPVQGRGRAAGVVRGYQQGRRQAAALLRTDLLCAPETNARRAVLPSLGTISRRR